MQHATRLIGWEGKERIEITKRLCHHYSVTGSQGEPYYMYSATGDRGTWHLNATKAWADAASN